MVFIIFLILGALFVIGSFFDLPMVYKVANLSLVPTLLLYYRTKAKRIFWPVVVAILSFYIRDIFMMMGFANYPIIIMSTFVVGIVILYFCAITGFRKSNMLTVELISLLIMYGFLGFLAYSMAEMVSEVIPTYSNATYIYLILLTVLLGFTFTAYLLKSHWASLWLMVASASLLVSEISAFFKLYVIEDISVNLFFPLFHIFMFYCLVQYALNRRRTGFLKLF